MSVIVKHILPLSRWAIHAGLSSYQAVDSVELAESLVSNLSGPRRRRMTAIVTALRIGGAIGVFGYGYHLVIQRSKERQGSINRDGFNFL